MQEVTLVYKQKDSGKDIEVKFAPGDILPTINGGASTEGQGGGTLKSLREVC